MYAKRTIARTSAFSVSVLVFVALLTVVGAGCKSVTAAGIGSLAESRAELSGISARNEQLEELRADIEARVRNIEQSVGKADTSLQQLMDAARAYRELTLYVISRLQQLENRKPEE